jgi:pyruvate kinase
MPVIWATQVLESLAKTGLPSRSEITDAAMGERAECVMLNKGPYIVTAVGILYDILRRMRPHQDKKRSVLRQLHVASAFHAGAPSA